MQKRKKLEEKRVEQAKRVYDQIQRFFAVDPANQALNKSKVAWLQQQFELDQLDIQVNNTLMELQKLNGGNPIQADQIIFVSDNEVAEMQMLWADKLSADAKVKMLSARESVTEQGVKLKKNKLLPDLTSGYNYQGVNSSNYSGF
ncbi:hypothetical protein [Salegentibacter sp. 24]|uniref:hypothetical protein n=1 Tax=Salegentibacter sp. 24 TaxID=2183986 RepID=UPI001FB7CCF0|nr:hypothetical protein [Salegentibacter sp. 24]